MFRQMRRGAQLLDTTLCHKVLSEARRGVLSVLGDEGYPYGLPINFVFDPDAGEHGSILFHSALEGHKVDALAACSKASFCAMDEGFRNEGEWWWYVHSVVCFGRAQIVEDPQRKHDALAMLAKKYFPPSEDIEGDIAKNGHRINMVELRIEHLTGKIVQEK